MNDTDPDPSPPTGHPAPSEWVPLSGLALSSFLMSLVLAIVALLGFWIVESIPLALGVYTLTTFKTGARRGRMLAIWAIVVSLSAGSCSLMAHQSMRTQFGGVNESILSALSAKETDANRDAALRPWVWSQASDKDPELLSKWRARYAQAEEAYGAWSGTFDYPSVFVGSTFLFVPPDGLTEIGSEDSPSAWTPKAVIWTPAVFERGTVYVAVILHEGDQEALQAVQKELKPGTQSPIVGDVRFYERRRAAGG